MMPSVLILARDFPPYNLTLGNVVRVLKLAEFLEGKGYKVFIVAAQGEIISYFGYEALLGRLNVHYVPDALQKYATRKHLGGMQPKESRNLTKDNPYLAWTKKFLMKIAVPDLGVLFQNSLYQSSVELILQHNIKNLIVSSPPHSTQLIGWRLKGRFRDQINLIIDYRDSWNNKKPFRKEIWLLQKLNEFLESLILRRGDALLYVSRPMLAKIDRKFRKRPPRAELVMNGFDEKMIQASGSGKTESQLDSHEALHIGHFGGLAIGPSVVRDVSTFCNLIQAHRLPIKLFQYGYCNDPDYLSEVSGGKAEVRGTLEHAEAIGEMKRMDVLLFLHTQKEDSDEVVSGKIFDYMIAQRPILSIGPPDMEAHKIIKKNGLGYCADLDDEDAVRQVLTQLCNEKKSGSLAAYDVRSLSEYSRQNQYEKLLPLLRV